MKIRIIQTVVEFDFGDDFEAPVPEPQNPPSFLELLCRQAERVFQPEPTEKTIYGQSLSQ